jgi:hypothetical protein
MTKKNKHQQPEMNQQFESAIYAAISDSGTDEIEYYIPAIKATRFFLLLIHLFQTTHPLIPSYSFFENDV